MTGVVIRPLRFTNDVDAMRAFLETVGLTARIESERGGWAVMLAGHGMIALHDAATSSTGGRPGQTDLVFEAEDVDALKATLDSTGYADVSIWDEAYGRVLSAIAPNGTKLWVDERSEDLYGYRLNETPPDERWSVTPYLAGTDQAAWTQILDLLGARQHVYFGPGEKEGVRMDLSTSEDLAAVLQRLTDAGYQTTRTGDTLEVVDPDGQPMVVHG
ncbi:VOC family protein [Kribbella sp. NPDC050281]|uniref:VOC family protein n=1 Tax=Kribbella sp. NPDC050281 TaxID=3155515 RepID=UPI00340A975F